MNQKEETIYQPSDELDAVNDSVVMVDENITMVDEDDADIRETTNADDVDDIEEAIEFTYDTPDPMDGINITSNDSEDYASDDLFLV